MLKIALAGAGMISQYHLNAWRALAGRATVVAVCDPDLARARDRADEHGIAAIFSSADALFASGTFDAVDIASPRDTHADWVRAAARSGAAVLCQKPMTPDLATAEALVAEIGGRIRFMVHDNWRFRPWYRTARQWIDDGLIGKPQLVRMALLSSGFLPDADGTAPMLRRQPFMQHETKLLIAEVMIHHLDTCRYLLGEMDVAWATLQRDLPETRGETSGNAVLRTRDGCTVLLSGSLAAPGYPAMPFDRLDIVGSLASITIAGERVTLSGTEPREVVFDFGAAYQRSFDDAISHFVVGLETGAPFETSAVDNLETMRLVDDIYRQAEVRP